MSLALYLLWLVVTFDNVFSSNNDFPHLSVKHRLLLPNLFSSVSKFISVLQASCGTIVSALECRKMFITRAVHHFIDMEAKKATQPDQ